jgi:phosphoadenosine phosphosulfate reductase
LDLLIKDPDQALHKRDTDACCALRKTAPLNRALKGFDGWITGRKRFQGGTRAALEFFEAKENTGQTTGRIKVNPLAFWRPGDIRTYMEENRLPRHPMAARGYPSLGCMPCTSKVSLGEDPRTGRWRGSKKSECGIHFVEGKMVRTGEDA